MKFKIKLFLIFVAIFSQLSFGLDSFEIHVHSDEMSKAGQANLELSMNNFLKAREESEYEGEVPLNGRTNFTSELALGVTDIWELGASIQAAIDSSSKAYLGGFKFRSKFARPKNEGDVVSYSLNLEAGYSPFEFKENGWSTEVRPIICIEGSQWHWHVNPIFAWSLSGGSGLTPDLEFAMKLGYQTNLGFTLGLEHFAEFGPLSSIPSISEQEHVTFLVSEINTNALSLGFGVGHGLTHSSPEWITKLTIGKSL